MTKKSTPDPKYVNICKRGNKWVTNGQIENVSAWNIFHDSLKDARKYAYNLLSL